MNLTASLAEPRATFGPRRDFADRAVPAGAAEVVR